MKYILFLSACLVTALLITHDYWGGSSRASIARADAEIIKHEYAQYQEKLKGIALQALITCDKAERLNEQTKDVEVLVRAISISQGVGDE